MPEGGGLTGDRRHQFQTLLHNALNRWRYFLCENTVTHHQLSLKNSLRRKIIVNGENIITEYELSNANCQICIVTVKAFYADLHRTTMEYDVLPRHI